MQSGVYIIRNTISGKCYVGSAANVESRWYTHRKRLRGGYHHNPHLQASWKAYGEEAFEWTVVEECEISNLLAVEQHWIDKLQATDNRFGYNIALIAGAPMRGRKQDESTIEKRRLSRAGYRHSEETKAKIAAAHVGIGHTPEARAKISEAGKRRPKETYKARPAGWKHSPEAIAKIATASRNISDETRAKLSEKTRQSWAKRREQVDQLALLELMKTSTEIMN